MAAQLSRVRKYRKSVALAQRELALLVGLGSQHAFSDVELGAKRPSLDVAIACALAFEIPARELFPHLARDVEREMLDRARTLHAEIATDPARREAADYLATLINRLAHTTLL